MDMHFQDKSLGERQSFSELSPSFRKFGMGCLFVRKFRMSNGRIWEMDVKRIFTRGTGRGRFCGCEYGEKQRMSEDNFVKCVS